MRRDEKQKEATDKPRKNFSYRLIVLLLIAACGLMIFVSLPKIIGLMDFSPKVKIYDKARFLDIEENAQAGDSDAQYELGKFYFKGFPIEDESYKQDYIKALYWLEKAAAQNNAKAQNFLGYMYANGEGVEKNFNKATSLFRKSVNNGSRLAASNLAWLHLYAEGSERNFSEGGYYLQIASERGLKESQDIIEKYYQDCLVKMKTEEAAASCLIAAGAGRPLAQKNIAMLYYIGRGIPKDPVEAFAWGITSLSKLSKKEMREPENKGFILGIALLAGKFSKKETESAKRKMLEYSQKYSSK